MCVQSSAPCPLFSESAFCRANFVLVFWTTWDPPNWSMIVFVGNGLSVPLFLFFRSADFSNFPTTMLNSRRDVEPLARRNNTRSHGLCYRYRWKNLRRRTGLHLFSAQQAASGEKWRGYSSHRDGVFALCTVTPTSWSATASAGQAAANSNPAQVYVDRLFRRESPAAPDDVECSATRLIIRSKSVRRARHKFIHCASV